VRFTGCGALGAEIPDSWLVNDLLVRLGKRIQRLRSAKTWSQEEFAPVSGFHRTYVGQIERGEKNISFGNLLKIAGVLGVTLSELLEGLEAGGSLKAAIELAGQGRDHSAHRIFEIQKLARRLKLQQAALERTITLLDNLAGSENPKAGRNRSPKPGRKRARG